jgi:hypothetical protein
MHCIAGHQTQRYQRCQRIANVAEGVASIAMAVSDSAKHAVSGSDSTKRVEAPLDSTCTMGTLQGLVTDLLQYVQNQRFHNIASVLKQPVVPQNANAAVSTLCFPDSPMVFVQTVVTAAGRTPCAAKMD